MSTLIETIEDLQLRALPCIRVFDPVHLQRNNVNKNCVAISSRYGICVLVGPANKFYSCLTADIHKLGLDSAATSAAPPYFGWRTITYHIQSACINSISVNSDGSTLGLAICTTNGPFVEIFDVLAFAPLTNQQPFPIASIRLSTESSAHIIELEWNPIELDIFAAVISDGSICTIKTSSEIGSNFYVLGTANLQAKCVCWSPKGKQLVVGDLAGKIHQLKPDLSPVRVIESPKNIPIFGSESHFCCTAICWISTTEWLISHRPSNSPNTSPNIGLLVVKKQQSPKWTHFGDALPTSSKVLSFCPMLDWHMVFIFANDSPSVTVIGLRKENWVKFEFETFDIQMPLDANKQDTYPLGASIDFSSTTPIQLSEGGDKTTRNPPPFIHFLNSSGLLLSYAIVSLSNERVVLTKVPEQIIIENARFGQSPPGFVQPAVESSSSNQQQQTQTLQQTNNVLQETNQMPEAVTSIDIEQSQPLIDRQKEKLEIERKKLLETEMKKVEALEALLRNSIIEYTNVRNAQTQQIDLLRGIRCEVEKCASSLNAAQFFGELHNIEKDLHQSVRHSVSQVGKICMGIHHNLELLNGLKLFYIELNKGMWEKQQKTAPSFDTEKRLQLTGKSYESLLDKMAKAKRLLNRLDDHQNGLILSRDEYIDPLEQRKIIQINSNIAKMCDKLKARLQRFQHTIRESTLANRKTTASFNKTNEQMESTKLTAEFCAMELEQLTLQCESKGLLKVTDTESATNTQQFQNSMRRYLMDQSDEIVIRRIYPLQTTKQTLHGQKFSNQHGEADLYLAKRIERVATSPPKPQMVSIGIQSPDFLAKSYEKTHKKTSKKGALTNSTTPVSTKIQSIPTRMPSLPSVSTSSSTMPSYEPPPISVSSTIQTPPFVTTTAAEPSLENKPPEISVVPSVGSSTSTSTDVQRSSPSEPKKADEATKAKEPGLIKETETQPNLPIMETLKTTEQLPKPSSASAMMDGSETIATSTGIAEEGMGMEDEMSGTAIDTSTPVTFDFMKSSGAGGMGLGSSTPINPNRNPFGSITPVQSGGGSSSTGSAIFGTPASSFGAMTGSFGTPTAKPAFGSLGASPQQSSSSSAFGASPFASTTNKSAFGGGLGGGMTSGANAFGGGATFGSTSPFASAKPQSGFGTTAFGGGSSGAVASVGAGGKSMFGGGITSGSSPVSSGFSAFANKSTGFGQLANQSSQQQQQGSSSLFGRGVAGFSGFGSTSTPISANSSSFNQPKPSAFTTFRK